MREDLHFVDLILKDNALYLRVSELGTLLLEISIYFYLFCMLI